MATNRLSKWFKERDELLKALRNNRNSTWVSLPEHQERAVESNTMLLGRPVFVFGCGLLVGLALFILLAVGLQGCLVATPDERRSSRR